MKKDFWSLSTIGSAISPVSQTILQGMLVGFAKMLSSSTLLFTLQNFINKKTRAFFFRKMLFCKEDRNFYLPDLPRYFKKVTAWMGSKLHALTHPIQMFY
ncbi:MAG: hypothetical protein HC771_25055 [Synechococcales cyanobacterium CRU_2_2]|nr:hypothetical protein [Synechococcales cyanobacterium CRU_2_2]